ncbi:MAG TPA: hypothetical protein VFQ45_20305 [Longimicrobium sp.]|nr:hypothetical protein [Longimicrobium sp.]
MPARRPGTPRDPDHLPLMEVRRSLLRLHKALIDSERAEFERVRGSMSNGQFLQALLTDPFFAWLRPYSGLLADIDEAFAGEEPVTRDGARAFVDRIRALALPAEAGDDRLARVRQRDPGVLFAHTELTRGITAALDAYGPAAPPAG